MGGCKCYLITGRRCRIDYRLLCAVDALPPIGNFPKDASTHQRKEYGSDGPDDLDPPPCPLKNLNRTFCFDDVPVAYCIPKLFLNFLGDVVIQGEGRTASTAECLIRRIITLTLIAPFRHS